MKLSGGLRAEPASFISRSLARSLWSVQHCVKLRARSRRSPARSSASTHCSPARLSFSHYAVKPLRSLCPSVHLAPSQFQAEIGRPARLRPEGVKDQLRAEGGRSTSVFKALHYSSRAAPERHVGLVARRLPPPCNALQATRHALPQGLQAQLGSRGHESSHFLPGGCMRISGEH